MKNRIQYSSEALNDLDEIWNYIFSGLHSPSAAKNTIENIINAVDRLEDFSGIGTPLSSITDIENDYRFLVSGNYMVFYRTSGYEVYIDRILYSKRDYLKLLFPDFT